ncbi:MAG TPA: cytochrome-c peroxidase [Polyangiaceae bacterium]|jgi:cytochrome c peroxidase|nr:cytochrome-c peroxidase [Polyangiaceae bacterium]
MCAWRAELRVLAAGLLLVACGREEPGQERARTSDATSVEFQKEPIQPLELDTAIDQQRAELGGRLFHDPRLSADGSVACSSCHDIGAGGDDGKPRSIGIKGASGDINAPTVLNAGNNFVQFWDGRAASLEEQAGGPLTNPLEMGNSWDTLLQTLGRDAGYAAEFKRAFSDGLSEANVRTALATFQRTLITVDSRFDRWLRGQREALSAEESAGYELFKNVGCVACHQGRNVGGNMFQRFGVMGDYFATRGEIKTADLGRFNVTKSPADRHVFRVPSLRNVELTAPYFHDASAATLEDAVRVMGRYQLGRPLSDGDVARIVSFLKTLTGKIPDVSRFVRVQAGSP